MSYTPPSRSELESLARRILSFSKADACRVGIEASWRGNTRFAAGEITTAGVSTDANITITSTLGRRRASTTTNLADDASLRRAVELSERIAKLSPDDPELMPELAPQRYMAVEAFGASTAGLDAQPRAEAAGRVLQLPDVKEQSLLAAGFVDVSARATAVANSNGLFAHHHATEAEMSTTVRTPDGTGSGWASAGAREWSELDPGALGTRAARKALASRNPTAVEPGPYTVILEPQAVADLIRMLSFYSWDARQADEGRSPFSKKDGGNRIGETVVDQRVTISSDPADPDLRARPFDAEGLPVGRTVWIENGVLRNLAYSRFWAQKQGKQPVVSAGPLGPAQTWNLKMAGGTKSLDDLVAGTARGILVTHFFYIRVLEPRTVLLTGLTRDGTFLVEDGKISRPIKNLRWNESPLFMLNKVEDLGRAERTSAGVVVPAIKARDFTFTSISDAV
jgi:predicted Zn-dependent protease